jgi:thiamine-phosphate diphosphorylase
MASNLADALRLMLVTDDTLLGGRDPVAVCAAAVRGGVTAVQLRLKRMPPRDLVGVARALVLALPVPVLVNDRPDVALAAGAAGVHLGPDDLPPALARRVLGPAAIIGASVGLEAEADRARDADYWGVGPWRATGTKGDAGEALGEAGIRRILGLAGARPCIAIGGVRPGDVGVLRGLGCAGVAVASGLLVGDPEANARRYGEGGAGSGERDSVGRTR